MGVNKPWPINKNDYLGRAYRGCCGCGALQKFQTFRVFSLIYKADFKISGVSLNFQIIIRYFKYFYKKTFFVLKSILVLEMK